MSQATYCLTVFARGSMVLLDSFEALVVASSMILLEDLQASQGLPLAAGVMQSI